MEYPHEEKRGKPPANGRRNPNLSERQEERCARSPGLLQGPRAVRVLTLKEPCACSRAHRQANMAHMRQSRPDPGLDLQLKALPTPHTLNPRPQPSRAHVNRLNTNPCPPRAYSDWTLTPAPRRPRRRRIDCLKHAKLTVLYSLTFLYARRPRRRRGVPDISRVDPRGRSRFDRPSDMCHIRPQALTVLYMT